MTKLLVPPQLLMQPQVEWATVYAGVGLAPNPETLTVLRTGLILCFPSQAGSDSMNGVNNVVKDIANAGLNAIREFSRG